ADRGHGTCRATGELGRSDPSQAWFNLGDLDLATHLYRTNLLRAGATLSDASALIARRFGVGSRIMPMSDDPVATRVTVVADGEQLDLHFQEYWVMRRARDEVKAIRYQGVEAARPAPGVLQAIEAAEVVVLCTSSPIASLRRL